MLTTQMQWVIPPRLLRANRAVQLMQIKTQIALRGTQANIAPCAI
jgi:hypothetical protein